MSCSKRRDLNNNVSLVVPTGWKLSKIDSNTTSLAKDSIYLKVQTSYLTYNNVNYGFPSPLEFIKSSNTNDISSSRFMEDGIIYTNVENLQFEKNNNPGKIIKKTPKPILEYVVEIRDSSLKKNGTDYLCRFNNDGSILWIPFKLPEGYKKYIFNVDNKNGVYKKYYHPVIDSIGKFSLLIYDSLRNYRVSITSNVLKNDNKSRISEINEIINSVRW